MANKLAGWADRFWAWLIDIIIVGLFTGVAFPAGGFWAGGFVLFIYWTLTEFYRGQSVGKMAMNLKVVGKNGKKISLVQSAVQSFGKAFILPIDLIIGWLAMPGEKLRLFNRVSDTIVIKIKK